MDNNKIGIAYKSTGNGAGELHEISGGKAWFGHSPSDIDFLDSFSDGDKEFLTFLSFDENGCLITIVTPQKGRDGDNLSAYIYVPCKLDVDGDKIVNAWEALKRFLVNQDETAKLEEASGETYVDSKYPLSYKPSDPAGGFAYIQLNKYYNTTDILKNHLYQKEYAKYKYVFLIDENNDSMSLTQEGKDKFASIDPKTLQKVCILLPPDDKKPHDATICYIDDKGTEQKFPRYLQCFEGDKIQLFFKRDGFESKQKDVTIKDKEQKFEVPAGEWKKYVKKTDFHIISSENSTQEVKEFRLIIDGKEVSDRITIPESKLSKVKVKVTAIGYDDFEQENCKLEPPHFDITLKPQYKQVTRKILLKDTSGNKVYANLVWREQIGRKREIIVHGFHLVNDEFVPDAPKCDTKPKKKQEKMFKLNWLDMMIGSAATLVIVFLLALVGYFFIWHKPTGQNITPINQNNKEISVKDVRTQQNLSSTGSADTSSVEAAGKLDEQQKAVPQKKQIRSRGKAQ